MGRSAHHAFLVSLLLAGCDVFMSGKDVEWVSIPGGNFRMGSETGGSNERPAHPVAVPAFEMNRTEVTVAQYLSCVLDGDCSEPSAGTGCNWGVSGRGDHPVNCVDWNQASSFCQWAGGRLPSEAEWEYAARGGGRDIKYPWGDQVPTCEYAVMNEGTNEGTAGCGEARTWPVCSKTAGNTEQGLCDMAGNAFEWVQDWYHETYTGAPVFGTAWESPAGDALRVVRGGSWSESWPDNLRASNRDRDDPSFRLTNYGFRCGRPSR